MVRLFVGPIVVLSLIVMSIASTNWEASARDVDKIYTDQANDLVDVEGKPTTGMGFIDIMRIGSRANGAYVELKMELFPGQNIMESKDVLYGFLLTASADIQYYASYSNGEGRFVTPSGAFHLEGDVSQPSALVLSVPVDLVPDDDFEVMAFAIMSEETPCAGCALQQKVVAQDVAGFYGGQPIVDAQTAAPSSDSFCLGGIFLGGGLLAGLLVVLLSFGPLALKGIPGTAKHDEMMLVAQVEVEKRAADGVMDTPGAANDPERSEAWSQFSPRERLALIKSLDMRLGAGTCQDLAMTRWSQLPGAVQDWLMEDLDLLESSMAKDISARWASALEPARRELLEEHYISGRISYRWAADKWEEIPVEARLSILNSLRGKRESAEQALAQVRQAEVQEQYSALPQNPYMRQAQEERYQQAQQQQPGPQYQPQYQTQYQSQYPYQYPQQPQPAYPYPAYYQPYPYQYPPNPYYPAPAYYQQHPQYVQYQQPQQQQYQQHQQPQQPQPSRGDATRPAQAPQQMRPQEVRRKIAVKKGVVKDGDADGQEKAGDGT